MLYDSPEAAKSLKDWVKDVIEPKDVMLDLETASDHTHNALILSIGLVEFKFTPGAVAPGMGDTQLIIPSLREQIILGREMNKRTVKWWQDQNAFAQEHWLHPATVMNLDDTLAVVENMTRGKRVWAHGICFDIGNMESLFQQKHREPPWGFRDVRDCRTIHREFAPRPCKCGLGPCSLPGCEHPDRSVLSGTHDPIVDCVNQIQSLWARMPVGA